MSYVPLVIEQGKIKRLPEGELVDKSIVGLDKVDNTPDLLKPLSAEAIQVINTKIEDAPKNGLQYAREDGQWKIVEGDGGGLPPPDAIDGGSFI